MDNNLKSQILELYGSAQEYSDSGSYEFKYSIADKKIVAAGNFKTGYNRKNNLFKMGWTRQAQVFSAGEKLETKFLEKERYELKLGDGANMLHKFNPVKRLVEVGKSHELATQAMMNSFMLCDIIPPLLEKDLLDSGKFQFDASKEEFEIEESDEFFQLTSKKLLPYVKVLANKEFVIKEVTIELNHLPTAFKINLPKFVSKHFETIAEFFHEKLPATLLGVYKFDKVSMNSSRSE